MNLTQCFSCIVSYFSVVFLMQTTSFNDVFLMQMSSFNVVFLMQVFSFIVVFRMQVSFLMRQQRLCLVKFPTISIIYASLTRVILLN